MLPVMVASADQPAGKSEDRPVVKIGKALPDFSLPDQTGKPWKLSAQKGKKVVAVVLGSANCFCGREALKDLQAVQDRYAQRGLQVVHINIDAPQIALDPDYLKKFAAANKITYPLLADKDLSVSSLSPAAPKPALFLVDKEGILRFMYFSRSEDYVKRVSDQVEKLLPPTGTNEEKQPAQPQDAGANQG